MAASTALMQAQVTALQQANEAMYRRRKRKRKRTRKRKAIQSDHVLSVGEVQAIVNQDYIKAEVREEMPRPKRVITYSRCGKQGHTIRICKVR
jgi:hypothetical protein